MKLDEKSGFILTEIYKTIKTAINLFRLKYINLKRERLENDVNKIYGKFNKNYEMKIKKNSLNTSTNNNKDKNSIANANANINNFEIHDCKLI
jgi:hypothetical protein